MICYTLTPQELQLLEAGLKKKRYQQNNNEIWIKGATYQKIGGSTIWQHPKDENQAFIIFHNENNSALFIAQDQNDIISANNDTDNLISNLKQQIQQNTPVFTQTATTPWTIPTYQPIQFNKTIKEALINQDLNNYAPERLKRFYAFTLDETKHCQIIIQSDQEDHIGFLHSGAIDGTVIAGGIPCNKSKQTSFDKTLPAGTYYIQVYMYDFTGGYELTVLNNCTSTPERPFMYDENYFDAFGNNKNDFRKLTPQDYTISCDNLGQNINNIIDDDINTGITDINYIQFHFLTDQIIQQIKITGNQEAKDFFIDNYVFFQGAEEFNGNPSNGRSILRLSPEPGAMIESNECFINEIYETEPFRFITIKSNSGMIDGKITSIELYE